MAPTVCVAEFPMAGTTLSTYVRRRQIPQNGVKQRTLARGQILLRTGTIVETFLRSPENCLEYANRVPNCSIPNKNTQSLTNMDEHYKNEHFRMLVTARKDLLSIVIRTIILVRRNRILQKRVNALRAETRRFFCSVLNNPENRRQQRKLQLRSHSESEIVSSSMEKVVSVTSPLLGPRSTRNSFQKVISTCDNCDYTNDDSSSSDKSEDLSRNEC